MDSEKQLFQEKNKGIHVNLDSIQTKEIFFHFPDLRHFLDFSRLKSKFLTIAVEDTITVQPTGSSTNTRLR